MKSWAVYDELCEVWLAIAGTTGIHWTEDPGKAKAFRRRSHAWDQIIDMEATGEPQINPRRLP